jgi:hypothetical protein
VIETARDRWPSIIRTASDRARALDVRACWPIASLRTRQRRTEIRQAIALLCATLAEFCDLATLTIGRRDYDGRWSARGIRDMSHASGLSFRRVQRALQILGPGHKSRAGKWIGGAGMITVRERRERGDVVGGCWVPSVTGRQFRSRCAVRQLGRGFWRALGLELAVTRERNRAIKRLRSRQPRAANLAAATVAHLVDQVSKPWRARDRALVDQREYIRISMELRHADPGLPAGEIARRADEILRASKS